MEKLQIDYDLEKDLKDLFAEGSGKVQVVADFDGTLTKDFVDGKKLPSLISVLRDNPGYLSPGYQKEAHALYEKYHGYEMDTLLSLEERKAKMQEWWEAHYKLLKDSGLKYDVVYKAANSGIIQFREGAREFLEQTNRLGIPVVVFSASGLGDVVPIYCQQEGVNFGNIFYVTNRFIWDKDGNYVDYQRPIIHSLNKDEGVLAELPEIKKAITGRVRVLLLGNSLGDAEMTNGLSVEKGVSVGFADAVDEERAIKLQQRFDYVLRVGYEAINKVLKGL